MQKCQSTARGNAPGRPAPSLRERAYICAQIRRELDLEILTRANARREIRARLSIGLKPFPMREAM